MNLTIANRPPAPTAAPGNRADRRRIAFWLLTLVFAATMLGTTLPTPLYGIYQARWNFSAAMVTVIFAVYGVAVLATLLLAGRSSDQAGAQAGAGRRPRDQHAEHRHVHPRPRRGGAYRRPDSVRVVGRPDD